jgi:hypothetical protein
MGTPFEEEADTARRMANDLMDKYRLEQWEIAQAEAGRVESIFKPVRKDIDISWYADETQLSLRTALWSVYCACAKHCAVVVSGQWSYQSKVMPVYGLESDVTFMQMLFTDLYIQMSDKIKPKFNPDASLGENVYRAKEAGMKYGQIAKWAGHPEWITIKGYSKKYGDPQYAYNGIMIREMKKYAKANGLEIHKVINLDAYVEDFCTSFTFAIRRKFAEMRGDESSDNPMAIAIRDITDLSRELLWEDFPDLKPHPDDCDCDLCHRCYDPKCQRPRCKEARKPIRYSKTRYREPVYAAQVRGQRAGESARIMGRNEAVGKTKEME